MPKESWRLVSVNGPMARNVRDLGLMLDAMACPEAVAAAAAKDGAGSCEAAARDEAGSYEAAALQVPSRKLRVAFSANLGGVVPVEPEVAEICRAAAKWFADGAYLTGVTTAGDAGDTGDTGGVGASGVGNAPAGQGDSSSGSGGGGAVEGWDGACPDLSDAPRLFRVLRALACQDMLQLLEVPGVEKIVKPDCLWQVG